MDERLIKKEDVLGLHASIGCPACKAVLMAGVVLPPGRHDVTCQVCGVVTPCEIQGGTLTVLAAVVASTAEEVQERLSEYVERKRQERKELIEGIESGRVGDPFTATVFGSILAAKILGAVAISLAITAGTALVTRALTPRQKFTTGQLQGSLTVPQSDEGLPIAEGYGADPASKASAFQTSHAYVLEDRVVAGGYFYVVTTAGTSAGSAPTFPATVGASVTSGSVVFTNYGKTGGGFNLPMIIVWTSGIRKHTTTTRGGGGGKGPKPPEQTEITYDLDLAIMPGRGPLNVKKIKANTDVIYDHTSDLSGVPDPLVPPDDPYDPDSPHSPLVPYTRPTERFSGTLGVDGNGVRTGTVAAGSYANIAIYPGNTTQDVDPTIQGAVDAAQGSGSTTAYRNRCLEVLKNFYLTKYGGSLPLISTLAEHETIDTFELINNHLSGRTGVLISSDYDFSGVRRIFSRGFTINPPYNPADVMQELAEIYNCYFTESDKIRCFERGSIAPVASLTSADVGWLEGNTQEAEQTLPSLPFEFATETAIARRTELTYIDIDRNFEQNTQGYSRQVTSSEATDKIELAVTLNSDEARKIAQRKTYRSEVEATKYPPFTLNWTYLWLNVGDAVTIAETDGTTSRVFIESIKPGDRIEVSGVAEDTAAYSQPVTTSYGVFETPPVPIPGQTLFGLYDGPLLRDEENTVNNGLGFYAWAVKRYGDGDFTGSALYVDRDLGDDLLATFTKQATFGVTASTLTASTNIHDVVADTLTVDLHNTDDTLESVTRTDLLAGANACIVGSEVCQIFTATREADTVTYPNRWYLVIGLRARRGSDYFADTHTTGERFVLINDAIQFVPMNVNEQNVERNYRMVSDGQSLDDAATVAYTFTPGGAMKLPPVNAHRRDNSRGDSLIEFSPRDQLGHGLHSGLSGFSFRDIRKFEMELTDSGFAPLDPPLTVFVSTDEPQLAVLESFGTDGAWITKFTGVTVNSFTLSGSVTSRKMRSLQSIREPNNFVEATLTAPADADATLGLISTLKDWKTATPDYRIVLSAGGGGQTLEVFDGTTSIYSEDASAYYSTGVRVRMEIIGSRVRFYKNYTGNGSHPIVESNTQPALPAIVAGGIDVGSSGSGTIADVILTTSPDPKAVLTQDQKDEYGIGSTIYALIYELDPRTGRGYPLQIALAAE